MAQGKSISSLMTENRKFPVPELVRKTAYINSFDEYQKMWEQSINDPDGFWLKQADMLTWFKKPTKSLEYIWDTKNRKIEHTWFADGEFNVSVNCLDRHLGTPTAKKTAIIWQGDDDARMKKLTYEQLHKEVCKFANVLKAKGIKKGDRVAHLHADGAGAGDRDAGLHPDRRDSLHRLRRLLAPTPSATASTTRNARCSSPPTSRCAAASTSSSRPSPTRR